MAAPNIGPVLPEAAKAILTGAASASGKLVLPPGRRDEVVAMLIRLVVNDDLRDAYCRAVTAERERLGVDVAMTAAWDSGDIPALEIARHGFGGLTDAQLADYAVSPPAIEAITEWLIDGDFPPEELGHWFVEAGMREVTVRQGDVERVEEFVLGEQTDTAQDGDRNEAEQHGSSAIVPALQPRGASWWLKFAAPVTLAASLLIAFYLGTFWPGRNDQQVVRLASVAVRGDVTRGIGTVALDIRNASDRRAFVTIVGLIPGRDRPVYHYRSEGRYLDAPPQSTVAVTNLPPEFQGATVLVVFLTRVPAGEAVREVSTAASPDSAEEYAGRTRKALAELGIDSDSKVVPLPSAAR